VNVNAQDEAGLAEGLRRLGLAGAAPEERFDRIVRLARRSLQSDAAVLAVAGPDRVWFKSAQGISIRETPREGSLFGQALLTHRPLVVADAAADARFITDGLVHGQPRMRFFAGHSLLEPAGHRVGVLAILGQEPRELSAEETEVLVDLAALAERELARSAFDALLIEYRQGAAWSQAVMDNVTEALITVGSDGRIQSVNRTAVRMFARSAPDLVGKPVGELLVANDREVLDRSIQLALTQAGQSIESVRITRECQAVNGNDDEFPVEVSLGGTWLADEDTVLVAVIRDLSNLRKAEDALLSSQLRHSATFDKSPMGICTVGPDLRLLDVNAALCAFVERSPEWLSSHTVDDITHPDDRGASDENYRLLGAHSIDRFSMENRYLTDGGEPKWGNLTVSGVFKPDGELDYFVAVVEDINERKRAEAQLVEAIEKQQRAIEDLDRISKAKSYFVSLVGHEFRTALTGIQGFSELLAEHDFGPDEVKEFAREIHSEGLRLTRMISEMLDLDRMESGRMKLNYGSVDLNALVADVVERFGPTTQLHHFVTALAPDLGSIQADSDKLTQVISNLLTNAIKYAPKGGEVVLTTWAEGDDVALSVKDEGLGVPSEALETIFERYARHEAKDRELIKGTGLGLPVVRQIVEMHGGRVWVENNGDERGATFTFQIPRQQPDAVG
jgi:PAS domain S-box-containing protein